MDDDFELWLGRIGKETSLRNQIHRAVNKAGGIQRPVTPSTMGSSSRLLSGRPRRFTGSRAGRGAAVGALLASRDPSRSPRARRAIVKARYVKLAGKGFKAATAHLRYLQRDGTTREGERGSLYGPDTDVADGKAFLEKGADDRHQFRFIVSAEDGAQYKDLKPMIRQLMKQVEIDLETKLDWVAVDHYNTGHPHTHIVVRGVDEAGRTLVIHPGYISRGLAERAAERINRDLGPRSEREIEQANAREVMQERFTDIDRRLLAERDEDGLASALHVDPAEQALRAGRLQTLTSLQLASEEAKGRYRLDPDIEATLRALGRRGDIIAAMHEQLRGEPTSASRDYAIFDPEHDQPIVGRVLARGLGDEHEDCHYLIIEATDGRTHHVDIGTELGEGTSRGMIVHVSPTHRSAREVDRTIAAVAAANAGLYDADRHQAYDRTATRAFAETHVRRLEAIRRLSGGLERQLDGAWKIGDDYCEKAAAHERRLAAERPVQITVLADRPLARLVRHDGLTWLDEQCIAKQPKKLHGRYGGEVNQALQQRRQWLIEQDLAAQNGDTVRYNPNLLATLRQRELARIGGQLSQELGLAFVPHAGAYIEGTFRQPVPVGRDTYALIEKSKEFTLVPWRPALARQQGKPVSGIIRETGISWTFGKGRQGPEIE